MNLTKTAFVVLTVSCAHRNDQVQDLCTGGPILGTGSAPSMGTLITPYVNATDIINIPEAFSTTASAAPWGFIHYGWDLPAASDHIPFQAVMSGTVKLCPTVMTTGPDGGSTGDYQVPYFIVSGDTAAFYNLEMFSSSQADVDTQMSDLLAKDGAKVNQGDLIFYFHKGNTQPGGAHVHFGLDVGATEQDKDAVCPQPYFTSGAVTSLNGLLHDPPMGNAASNLCY